MTTAPRNNMNIFGAGVGMGLFGGLTAGRLWVGCFAAALTIVVMLLAREMYIRG